MSIYKHFAAFGLYVCNLRSLVIFKRRIISSTFKLGIYRADLFTKIVEEYSRDSSICHYISSLLSLFSKKKWFSNCNRIFETIYTSIRLLSLYSQIHIDTVDVNETMIYSGTFNSQCLKEELPRLELSHLILYQLSKMTFLKDLMSDIFFSPVIS